MFYLSIMALLRLQLLTLHSLIMNKEVQKYLLGLEGRKMHLAMQIGDALKMSSDSIMEHLKYGRINYSFEGRDIAFLCIKSTHKHIELGFYHGSYLVDASKLLFGKSVKSRRIKIEKLDAALENQIQIWIKALLIR